MCVGKALCRLAKMLGSCNPPVIEKPEESGFMPEDLKSGYPVYSMSWIEVISELYRLGLKLMEKEGNLPDVRFYYTDEETWEKIIPYLTYSGEYFSERERKDCDDYSKKASADSSFYFGLNCLQAWGDSPLGYHAFNMVRAEKGWKVFEPNAGFECAGELLDIKNDYGWIPVKWKS